jgi:hypothetical protein
MADVLNALVVLAMVVYVWMVGPIRWFRGRKGRPLPDVW